MITYLQNMSASAAKYDSDFGFTYITVEDEYIMLSTI